MKGCEIEMAVSVLRTPDGRRLTDPGKEPEVTMSNSNVPSTRSLDIEGTPTVNAGRYEDANCRLRLNSKGQPLAIRPVVAYGQPGSFATKRHQVVMPSGITALSGSSFRAWDRRYGRPVN